LSDAGPTFDLQSHSVYSDGELRPSGVVERAALAGVELLALTDHDSLDGIPEALRAAEQHGISLVTGVEISALDQGYQDLHILGYGIDTSNPPLRRALERSRADRELRAIRMIEALAGLGFAIDETVLHARAAEGKTIGRPHLAEAVVAHPANGERLLREACADPSSFLEAYLIEDRPAFIPREAPSIQDAIELIHLAGGVAIWAHPFWDVEVSSDVVEAIDRFTSFGIDGVEAFYVTHSRDQTDLVVDHCLKMDLWITGSSDYHGPGHRVFNSFRAFSTYGRSPRLGSIDVRGARP
jgi:predicted metal-dependent phosphoesterase TrpH